MKRTERHRKYRDSPRGHLKRTENKKKNRQRRYDYVESYKANCGCSVCGESRSVCLEFHHKDRNVKNFDISKGCRNGYSLERIKKEILKCIVICANCHKILHAFDNGETLSKDELPLFD